MSGQEMEVLDDGQKILPHVFELSMGVDRSLYCILENFLDLEDGKAVLRLPPYLAPIDAAILPLVSKEPLTGRAMEIYDELRRDFDVEYDDSGSIGRRYMRYDGVGVPICITVDHQTMEDDTVTVRFRDSTHQIRVDDVSDLPCLLREWLAYP